MFSISTLVSLDEFAKLIFHNDRLPLLDHKPPRAREGAQLEILQLFISGFETHLDDYFQSQAINEEMEKYTYKSPQKAWIWRQASHPKLRLIQA